jgi:hypothetical protein
MTFLVVSVRSARGLAPALLNSGSMSPPGYPSAWLPPGRARLRFTWQAHCSSAAPCCSQHPACLLYVQVMPVIIVLRPPRSFVLMPTELIVRV